MNLQIPELEALKITGITILWKSRKSNGKSIENQWKIDGYDRYHATGEITPKYRDRYVFGSFHLRDL